MADNPENQRQPRIDVLLPLTPGEYPLDVEHSAEDGVFAVLSLACLIRPLQASVTFNDAYGDRIEITGEEFDELANEDPLTREAYLRGKANDILIGSDFKLRLVKRYEEAERN